MIVYYSDYTIYILTLSEKKLETIIIDLYEILTADFPIKAKLLPRS